MENIIAIVFLLAVIVEALIDYATTIIMKVDGKTVIEWKKGATIVLGIFLAIAAGADFLAASGLVFQIPYVGMVLTGIFFSRGSNYVSDFLMMINTKKTPKF